MSEDAIFTHAAVAAPHRLAAEAGRDILAQGGNALEAMVAMAASIAVVYPHMTGIGGDGFWLVREPDGKMRAIEACGFAGEKATVAAYEAIGGIPTRGPMAALTVPGAVAGWKAALALAEALGGQLPMSDLFARAVTQAREGVPVSPCEARSQPKDAAALYEVATFRPGFFIDGEPPKAGALRRQPRLADTIEQLAHAGLDDIYRGDIARELAADLDLLGSPVTRADLKAYDARWRPALTLKTRAARLYNFMPPTQGLASLMILGIYERLGISSVETPAHFHALIEASKRACAHRDRVCVDLEVAPENFEELLLPASLDREARAIDMARAAPWPLPADKGDTVWMGAIDAQGLAVSYIQSLYWEYGSGLVSPRTGALLANRGLAFSLDPRNPRALKPGRRPFHTLNPALAEFPDGSVMSYGSMGGDGQPQFQAQTFTRIAAGKSLVDAVAAPRFLWGRTWGEASITVKVEASFDDGIAAALARMGHEVERLAPEKCDTFGHAGALRKGPKGEVAAAHDPRSDGGALGL